MSKARWYHSTMDAYRHGEVHYSPHYLMMKEQSKVKKMQWLGSWQCPHGLPIWMVQEELTVLHCGFWSQYCQLFCKNRNSWVLSSGFKPWHFQLDYLRQQKKFYRKSIRKQQGENQNCEPCNKLHFHTSLCSSVKIHAVCQNSVTQKKEGCKLFLSFMEILSSYQLLHHPKLLENNQAKLPTAMLTCYS